MTTTSTFAPSLSPAAPAAARSVFRLLPKLNHGSLRLC